MPAPSRVQMENAIDEVKGNATEAERALAVRALKRMDGVECDEGNIERYLALKRIKGKGSKIHPHMLGCTSVKEKVTKKMKQKFWIIRKDLAEEGLETRFEKKWYVNPLTLVDFPSDVARGDVFVLDGGVPQFDIGPHALEWSSSVSTQATIAFQAPAALPDDNDEPPPLLPSEPRSIPLTDLQQGGSEQRGAITARVLMQKDSNPEEENADAAESIAVHAAACAEKGNFVTMDRHNNDTVEFWFNSYIEFIVQRHQEYQKKILSQVGPAPEGNKGAGGNVVTPFVATLPVHAERFVKYIVKVLLGQKCFQQLPAFAKLLEKVKGVAPELVPDVGRILMAMAAMDLRCEEPLPVSSLSFAKKAMLFESALYGDFLVHRFDARLGLGKDLFKTSPGACLRLLEDLSKQLPVGAGVSKQEEVEVPRLVLSEAPVHLKLEYLIASTSRFEVLRSWSPTHPYLCVEEFFKANQNFKTMDPIVYRKAADTILPHPSVVQKMPNPVLKQLLVEYAQYVEICKPHGRLEVLACSLFLDLSALRLGLTSHLPAVELELIQEDVTLVQGLMKVMGNTATKKWQQNASELAILLQKALGLENTGAQHAQHQPVGLGSENTGAQHAQHQPVGLGNTEQEQLPAVADQGQGKDSPPKEGITEGAAVDKAGQGLQEAVTSVFRGAKAIKDMLKGGETIRIRCVQHKAKYNGCLARVIKPLSQTARVCMLEGPCKNEERPFCYANIVMEPEKGKEDGMEGGPTKKAKIDVAAERSAAATKLFGNVEDM